MNQMSLAGRMATKAQIWWNYECVGTCRHEWVLMSLELRSELLQASEVCLLWMLSWPSLLLQRSSEDQIIRPSISLYIHGFALCVAWTALSLRPWLFTPVPPSIHLLVGLISLPITLPLPLQTRVKITLHLGGNWPAPNTNWDIYSDCTATLEKSGIELSPLIIFFTTSPLILYVALSCSLIPASFLEAITHTNNMCTQDLAPSLVHWIGVDKDWYVFIVWEKVMGRMGGGRAGGYVHVLEHGGAISRRT